MDGAAPAPSSDVARERLGSAPHSDVVRERLKMLEWRCRRGMKELDILLLRYLRQHLASGDAADCALFAEFLELPDPVLARYLIAGDVPPEPRHAALCRTLLAT